MGFVVAEAPTNTSLEMTNQAKCLLAFCCSLFFFVAACSGSQDSDATPQAGDIAGVLLNGQSFTVSSTPPLETQIQGISGAILIDLEDGVAPLEGPVLGIATFDRLDGPQAPGAAPVVPGFDEKSRTLVVVSGDWYMKLAIYGEVAEELGENYGAVVQDAIEPMQSSERQAGLPAFELLPPLRWLDDDEVPLHMMVMFPDFAVRRGCSDLAVACNADATVEVVPMDELYTPHTKWPGGQVEISAS